METSSSRVSIASDGGDMSAFVAKPVAPGPHPAVIVLMEAFGLVPNLEREAERVAATGTVAIAPDLHHRQGPDAHASYDDLRAAMALVANLRDGEGLADLRATLAWLRGRGEVGASPIGVTGFCHPEAARDAWAKLEGLLAAHLGDA